jgi:uncharacterized protein with beta-barrel porin domain
MGGGYNYNRFNWVQSYGYGFFHSVYGGVYADYSGESLFIGASAIGAGDWFHHTRHIFFPGYNAKAYGEHFGAEYAARLTTSYDVPIGLCFVKPFISEEYFYLHERGFSEDGAGVLNLVVDAKTTKYLRSEVGASVSRAFEFHSGCWSPTLSLSYVNLYQLSNRNYSARFAAFTDGFNVWRYSRSWNMIAPAFDLTFNLRSGLSITAKYRAELNGVYQMNEWDMKFAWNF